MFITVAGNMGSGKSTLVARLAELLNWTPLFESVDDNPYLEKFHAPDVSAEEKRRHALPLQMHFLEHRARSHLRMQESTLESFIQDRSIYEGREVFLLNLVDTGLLSEAEYQKYVARYDELIQTLRPPPLMVYLKRSLAGLERQINQRSRAFELALPAGFLANLNGLYERWFDGYSLGPKLILDGDSLDFVQRPEDMTEIRRKIEFALSSIQARASS